MKKSKGVSKSFIGFLCVSILIWVLITMSKEYTTSIILPIAYENIPQNLLLQKEPLKQLEVTIKASGFKIALTKFKQKQIFLDASSLNRKKKSTYYLLTRSYKTAIQKQLSIGVNLQQIAKDSLFLNLGSLQTKKLPIVADVKIDYHVGYDLSSSIQMQPDSVLVSGPENQIKNLKSIQLEPIKLSDVKEDFSREVAIVKSNNLKNVRFNIAKVTVSGKVEKFTEGSLLVDVEILNLPENITINTLVKKVEVVYVVALSNFNKIDEDSFQIKCDYKTAENNNLNYLIPKIIKKPPFLKSVKLIPSKIDFLIQK